MKKNEKKTFYLYCIFPTKTTALYVFLADKVLIKSLENYVSSGDRSLLNITRFNKNKNKRKTIHFLDDSDDESQENVK